MKQHYVLFSVLTITALILSLNLAQANTLNGEAFAAKKVHEGCSLTAKANLTTIKRSVAPNGLEYFEPSTELASITATHLVNFDQWESTSQSLWIDFTRFSEVFYRGRGEYKFVDQGEPNALRTLKQILPSLRLENQSPQASVFLSHQDRSMQWIHLGSNLGSYTREEGNSATLHLRNHRLNLDESHTPVETGIGHYVNFKLQVLCK